MTTTVMKDSAYRIAANVFFIVHCAVSAFAMFGAFLAALDKKWLWAHIPVVLWIFIMNLADWTCPLTTWERTLRLRMAQPYSDSFIRHYLRPVVDATGRPRRLEIIVGTTILLWNVLLYSVIFSL